MALTNAERQARYRARLKQGASIEALGGRVRKLVDNTVDILWSVFSRHSPDGLQWAELEQYRSCSDYRRALAAEPALLIAACRDMLWVPHLLEDAEKRTLEALVEVADALAMRPMPEGEG